MKTTLLLTAVLVASAFISAQAAPPVVSNIRASQRSGTKYVDIYYDVSDADGDSQTIAVQISGDGGSTYTIPATALSGSVGAGVSPGLNRHIIWNAGTDWNGQYVPNAKVRVTASDGTTPAPPPGMVYIPAGVFQMGDNFNEGSTDELPVHTVTLNAFFMDRFEVYRELWEQVKTWGNANGYYTGGGSYKGAQHPVHSVRWYDAVTWCNARSEMEGLTPVYYTDDAQTIVRRSQSTINNAQVKWNANGYRLPTEAEWEKAARGGATGMRYPWGDTITGTNANYASSGDPFETGSQPYTSTIGYYPANGYGLHDIAGNALEWCWDLYGSG